MVLLQHLPTYLDGAFGPAALKRNRAQVLKPPIELCRPHTSPARDRTVQRALADRLDTSGLTSYTPSLALPRLRRAPRCRRRTPNPMRKLT
jgi:hypothetical protein